MERDCNVKGTALLLPGCLAGPCWDAIHLRIPFLPSSPPFVAGTDWEASMHANGCPDNRMLNTWSSFKTQTHWLPVRLDVLAAVNLPLGQAFMGCRFCFLRGEMCSSWKIWIQMKHLHEGQKFRSELSLLGWNKSLNYRNCWVKLNAPLI